MSQLDFARKQEVMIVLLRVRLNSVIQVIKLMVVKISVPKYLILLVEQDDADVGPKTVPVKHNQTSNFLN